MANAGSHGLRRLIETLGACAAVVVTMQVVLRLLGGWGVIGVQLTLNFEGYAANRNAFAFQLLTVMALVLGYARVYARYSARLHRSRLSWSFAVLLGIVLAGLLWTGSRAGWLVGGVMLLLARINRLADRKMIASGIMVGAILWTGVWVLSNSVQSALRNPVQSALSTDYSDKERWATWIHAVELWRESPVFGAGLGVLIAKSSSWLGHSQVIHSTPLWLLSEFGLIGVALMGWVFFLLVHHDSAKRSFLPARRALSLLILAFAIFSLAHEIFYQRIFWFVLGAVLAQPSVKKGRM